MTQGEVVSMLLGYTAMPFEANPALFQSINAPPNAQNMLRQMLQRNPTARPALKDVRTHSSFAILLVPDSFKHSSLHSILQCVLGALMQLLFHAALWLSYFNVSLIAWQPLVSR